MINFLGDSITYGDGLTDVETERFSTLVGERLGFAKVNNYGIPGTRIAFADVDRGLSFAERYEKMDADADVVLVFGGTNDYGHASINSCPTAPFGTFEDRDHSSFYGALHVLYSGLVNKYPGKTMGVMTPLPRLALDGTPDGGDYFVENPDTGKNLADYVDAIKEVAHYYSLPVLDLFSESGLQPIVPVIQSCFMPDGLHPNAAGHRILADKIESFLLRL